MAPGSTLRLPQACLFAGRKKGIGVRENKEEGCFLDRKSSIENRQLKLSRSNNSSNSSLDIPRLNASPFVRHVEFHAELGSTNDRALELARETEHETPVLVIAERQTAGRGRGANQWWSGPGALTFSLVLDPMQIGLQKKHWPRLALTAGLSVCEVLQTLMPQKSSALKWPNDVWLESKKVCGILVEIPDCPPPAVPKLVLGLGINVNNSLRNAPPEIQAFGTSLCDQGNANFDSTDVLISLLERLEKNLQTLAADRDELADRWQSLCALTGRTVEVHLGSQCIRGVCRGIDREGALTLQSDQRLERIFGGVVTAIE